MKNDEKQGNREASDQKIAQNGKNNNCGTNVVKNLASQTEAQRKRVWFEEEEQRSGMDFHRQAEGMKRSLRRRKG